MGRGRAKAKQTKVARQLKYHTPNTDFAALERELGGRGNSDGEHPDGHRADGHRADGQRADGKRPDGQHGDHPDGHSDGTPQGDPLHGDPPQGDPLQGMADESDESHRTAQGR